MATFPGSLSSRIGYPRVLRCLPDFLKPLDLNEKPNFWPVHQDNQEPGLSHSDICFPPKTHLGIETRFWGGKGDKDMRE
jgi:hypothetical protein